MAVVLTATYVGLLAYSQGLARERREKVHYLHHGYDDYEDLRVPTLSLLQRSAN
ncbi:MAG: hypothetical protein U5R31_05830 [Acidimicrobiia bacterium]|nr:hypothetical protein [Acidimicrobiia bacterium]